jgi:spore germination protein GerM
MKRKLIWFIGIATLLHAQAVAQVDRAALTQPLTITTGRVAGVQAVKLFLIAIDDAGRSGRQIGCGDSVVAVTREIRRSRTPLRATIEELLRLPERYGSDPELYNALHQPDLRLESISVRRGLARINFAGQLVTRGVCDSPRVQAQIEETAVQFPIVKKVQVFINGTPLSEYLSERG